MPKNEKTGKISYATRKEYPKGEKNLPLQASPELESAKENERNRVRAFNQDMRNKSEELCNTAIEARRRYDWEWLLRDLFRRGYQFSRYSAQNQSVVISNNSKIRIPINLVWSHMRVVRNQLTSFRPKWEVMPVNRTEEAQVNARYSGKLLDYYFDHLNLRKKIKETAMQGLMYSVGGPWQIGYDEDADNGNGEVYIWLLDTFDFYIDPQATCIEDAEYCFKAVVRPMDEVKNNANYTFYQFPQESDKREALSEYKQFLMQAIKNNSTPSNDVERVIVKEMWQKVRVNDDNSERLAEELRRNDQDDKELKQGEVLMRVITYTDGLIDPMRVQLLRRNYYPFVLYHADINPLEVYGESWIKHLIPINRALNALESSTFKYNYKYGVGRFVVDKGAGATVITNEHGDVIQKNQGYEVTSLPLAQLPSSYQIQIQNLRQYFEDISGSHDASLGRIPEGIKSGVGIAELKSADASNHQDLFDNLEDFLVEVADKLLKEIAINYDVPKMIKVLGRGKDAEHFMVVGEKTGKKRQNKRTLKIDNDVLDLAVIGLNNEIKVSVGSWLAYTKEAQREKLKEFYEAGIIDQATFLEHAEFNDVNKIIEDTRKEKLLEKYMGQPAQEGMPSDMEIAEQENIQMTKEGKMPEALPEDNHQVHLVIHQEGLGMAENPIVEAHMQQHERFIEQGINDQTAMQTGVMPQAPLQPAPSQPLPQTMMNNEPLAQEQPMPTGISV